MNGFIQLHRKLLDNPIFQNEKLLKLFIYCLLKASYKDRETMIGDSIVKLSCGQLVIGRKALARDLDLSEQQVRTLISKLKKLNILHTKATNKYTIVTVINWGLYQNPTSQSTNEQPTINQQSTTNNKVNKDNKVNKSPKADRIPYSKIAQLYNEVCTNLPQVLNPEKLNDKRKRAIKKFWNHSEDFQNSDYLTKYFETANRDDFLTGNNKRGWKADLEFLMRIEQHDKLREKQRA